MPTAPLLFPDIEGNRSFRRFRQGDAAAALRCRRPSSATARRPVAQSPPCPSNRAGCWPPSTP